MERTGEVMGDCRISTPLGRRGLFIRKGEDGGTMDRAGDCCRLDMTLGRMRLLRFRSRELATLPRLNSDEGESARLVPDMTDEDRTLVSLSAPASLSKCIECRLFCAAMVMAPACERGVREPPLGLLDPVEPATDDSLRPKREGSDASEAWRRACAMADGASNDPGNMPPST